MDYPGKLRNSRFFREFFFDRWVRWLYHARPMPDRLPVNIEPLRLAKAGRSMHGRLALTQMQRLKQSLQSAQGDADVELHFGVDENGVHYVRGLVRADLELVCQRCLQPISLHVDAELVLGIVASEREAGRLPGEYEPLLVGEDGLIRLSDLVEDELLLALPIVAMHPEGECAPAARPVAEPEAGEENEAQSPFAVLEKLKNRRQD